MKDTVGQKKYGTVTVETGRSCMTRQERPCTVGQDAKDKRGRTVGQDKKDIEGQGR